MLNRSALCVHLYVAFLLSCLAWSDTRAILSINNFRKELLIINAENSERERKQRFTARTFNENAIKAISLQTTKWICKATLPFFFLSTEITTAFLGISPNDGPSPPRWTRRMVPASAQLAACESGFLDGTFDSCSGSPGKRGVKTLTHVETCS